MADVNLASLNFELKIQDNGFDEQIKKIKDEAKALNTEISNLLDVKRQTGLISKDEHQTRMRQIQEESAAAMATQRQKLQWSRETAKIAVEEAKGAAQVATAVEKTNNEKKKGLVIEQQIAAASTRAAEAEVNRAAATSRKAKADQDAARAEIQRQTASINQAAAEERKATATNNRIASQQRLNYEMEREGTILRRNSRFFNDMKNVALAYFSFDGARRLVSSLVRVSAEFEKQRVSLHAILQDADGAEKIFGQIKNLAVQSPFQFKELVSYTKQLSAFSIPMNELYDTTKMLADVSAGLGVGMDRLVLAYGQIRSASFLRGQEVRQLTEAGIPILTELAKQFEELEGHAVSAGEVFDRISKRQVTFEMVEKVFKDMTSEGGKFYQMQEVLAETLSGKLSNLTDAYQIMFSEIGEKTKGVLYGTVDALRSIAENYEEVGKRIIELVAIYGTYRAAIAAVNTVEAIRYQMTLANMAFFNGGGTIKNITAISTALKDLVKNTRAYQAISSLVAKTNPYALVAAAVAALGVAVYNLATRTSEYKKTMDELNNVVTQFNGNLSTELGNLDYTLSRMKSLNTTSAEYRDLKNQIINQYGQYLTDVDRENLAIGNLSAVYDHLAESIRKASIEKALSAGREKIAEYESGITTDVWTQFNSAMNRAGVDSAGRIGKELRDYISGAISSLSAEANAAALQIFNNATNKNALRGFLDAIGARGPWAIFGKDEKAMTIDDMRDALAQMRSEGATMRADLADQLGWMEELFTDGADNASVALDGWRADIAAIADAAAEAGANLEIAVDASSDLLEVRQKIDKELKESQERYEAAVSAGAEDDAKIWEQRVGYLQQMAARLGMGGESSSKGSPAGSLLDTSKDSIDRIRRKIDAYRDLKTAYQSLAEYAPDNEVRDLLAAIFETDMASDDFDKEIRALVADLYKLGPAGVEAAQGLQEGLQKEDWDAIVERYRTAEEASERYNNMLESWEGLMPNTSGVEKVVKDYQKKLAEIEKLRTDSYAALWDNRKNMSSDEYLRSFNQIHQNDLDAREAALDEARKNAEAEIKRIYQSWRDENLDFENLSDKTIAQLGDLKDSIKNFNFSSLTEDEQTLLLGLLGDLENIDELIEKIKAGDLGKLKSEEKTKDIRAWKQLAESILDAAKSLKEFGEASNNFELVQVADTITRAGELTKNVLNGFKNADIAGAAVAGVSTIATWLFDSATEAARLRTELESIARDGYLNAIDERLKSADTIFGTSWMGHLRALRSEIKGLASDMNSITGQLVWPEFGELSQTLDELIQGSAEILGMAAKDADGLYNNSTLEAILTASEKGLKRNGLYEDFQDLIEYNKKMKELFAELEKTVGEMFDSLGEDIADTLIESLKATGRAATDLEGVFQGLGESIFKSMVQSYVIDEILSKYRDEVQSWWTDESLSEEDIAGRIRNFANAVKQDIDIADERLTAMYNAFLENSLLAVADEASDKSTVGGGIKSITEDTANLLASYINAIRADVAAIRQAVAAEGAVNLPTPTLAEYLTQIQANTFNTAQNTANLLAELRSMMTVSDGPALRVFM